MSHVYLKHNEKKNISEIQTSLDILCSIWQSYPGCFRERAPERTRAVTREKGVKMQNQAGNSGQPAQAPPPALHPHSPPTLCLLQGPEPNHLRKLGPWSRVDGTQPYLDSAGVYVRPEAEGVFSGWIPRQDHNKMGARRSLLDKSLPAPRRHSLSTSAQPGWGFL